MNIPDNLTVSTEDLIHHVLKFGVDCFPPIDVRAEITHAHDFFERLQSRWPDVYQEIVYRPQSGEFQIIATYKSSKGDVKVPALVLSQRGPVFILPKKIQPLGDVNQSLEPDVVFMQSLTIARSVFPGRKVLRVGLIRELVFGTGKSTSVPYLAERFGGFPGASARGGNALLAFRDERCNIHVNVSTTEIHRQATTPTKQVISDETTYGLKVEFDVNNIEMKPQEDADILMTLERANSLWPQELLQFINWREKQEQRP